MAKNYSNTNNSNKNANNGSSYANEQSRNKNSNKNSSNSNSSKSKNCGRNAMDAYDESDRYKGAHELRSGACGPDSLRTENDSNRAEAG